MRKLKNDELIRKSIEEFRESKKIPIIILLDNVRSLNNVGSVFRTADAFLIEKIYLCGITGTPPNREIQKTALGATETVDWEYAVNIGEVLVALRSQSYKIVTIEQTNESQMLNEFRPEENQRLALIFGNEVDGVSDVAVENSDFSIEIPQFGYKHSLNISVSVGIIIWDLVNKLKLGSL